MRKAHSNFTKPKNIYIYFYVIIYYLKCDYGYNIPLTNHPKSHMLDLKIKCIDHAHAAQLLKTDVCAHIKERESEGKSNGYFPRIAAISPNRKLMLEGKEEVTVYLITHKDMTHRTH